MPVPGLANIFEYEVVDVKESVPERGDCASAVAATALKLSADIGSGTGSWWTGQGGRGCRSVRTCVESDLFFSEDFLDFEYAIGSLRPRRGPFEADDASRDAGTLMSWNCATQKAWSQIHWLFLASWM